MASLEEHPAAERLHAAMHRLWAEGHCSSLDETLYRFASPKHARWPDLVSGQGSKIRGSRWNPPGLTNVLHAASTPEAALAEVLAARRRFNLPDSGAMPLTLRAIRCSLSAVLDLTDGATRVRIRVANERLMGTDWERENAAGREALTQALGRAAFAAGYEGMVAPSVADKSSYNVVIFVQALRGESLVVLRER